MGKRRVTVVLGTRPEIVKLAPVIQLLGDCAKVIRTGQHFSPAMQDVGITARAPEVTMDVGSRALSRGAQLGIIVAQLDQMLGAEPPHAVIVQGDTTSALAGALAANAGDLPLVHVEAGLRSFDRRMPEEHNRTLIDHLADVCCAPNDLNRANLLAEGIGEDRIAVTGNTVVEAAQAALPDPAARDRLLRRYDLPRDRYLLATLHRPENVDDPATLEALLRQLGAIGAPVLFPLHPRTRRRIDEFRLGRLLNRLRTVGPLAYPDLLGLASEAALLVSDSGGLQEEASIVKRPIVVVRRSTERPEIEGTFGIRVEPGPALDTTIRQWLATSAQRRASFAALRSPYGDGTASRQIVDRILDLTARPACGVPAQCDGRQRHRRDDGIDHALLLAGDRP